MPIVSFLAVYLLIWSLVLQIVLPVGVRTQSENGDVVEGTEPGAPVRPRLKLKLLATTLISFVFWGVFYWWASATGLGLR